MGEVADVGTSLLTHRRWCRFEVSSFMHWFRALSLWWASRRRATGSLVESEVGVVSSESAVPLVPLSAAGDVAAALMIWLYNPGKKFWYWYQKSVLSATQRATAGRDASGVFRFPQW